MLQVKRISREAISNAARFGRAADLKGEGAYGSIARIASATKRLRKLHLFQRLRLTAKSAARK